MSERVNRWEPGFGPVGEPGADEDLHVSGQPSVRHRGDSVTTGTIPAEERTRRSHTRPVRTPLGRWLVLLAAGWVVLGALAGLVWWRVVPLPAYRLGERLSERDYADFIAGDAWFAVIGVVLGLACAVVCWWWFAGLGWPIVPLAVMGSLIMGLLCWLVGWWLGPGALEPRVADALPGAELEIELTLRSRAALLVWPFASVFVIMLISAFTRDPEESAR